MTPIAGYLWVTANKAEVLNSAVKPFAVRGQKVDGHANGRLGF